MAKRTRKPRRAAATRRRPRAPRHDLHDDQPDLIAQIANTLNGDDPLPLLGLASTLLAVTDPRGRHPLADPSEAPSLDELIESFLGVPLPETSALLAAIAGLAGDDVLRRRVHRAITERAHPLPSWLTGLHRAAEGPRAVEMVHTLGDGDNLVIAAHLPGGHRLTAVVYVDHNLGTLVKDAFVLSAPLDDVVDTLVAASEADPDLSARPLDPAAARARITEAVHLGSITFPPFETDTWPACRPLVEWMTRLLPEGGTGYVRPEWDEPAVAELARRFRASPFARGVEDPDDLLSSLLWFGTDYGPGDPLRWSPVAVEILMADWIPRKIVADAAHLACAPELLRAFVRFCHHERGIRADLTEQTLAAVDAHEPGYQRLIRSDRPRGPAALLAALGAFDEPEPEREYPEIMLDSLRRAVGGDAALGLLTTAPLPDETFQRTDVPFDVHDRVNEVLGLVDRCWTELLGPDHAAEFRTVGRRLLADVAAADPEIFRRGRAATAAAAICWLAGQANCLFTYEPGGPRLAVKDLARHFGVAGVSQRSGPMLRALGVAEHPYGRRDLGSPRYLTGLRRSGIVAARDRYRAMLLESP